MTARPRFIWLVVMTALSGCAQREATEVFGTALPTFKSATSVEAYRLTSEFGGFEYPGEYEAIAGPIAVSENQVRALRKSLLSRSSYGWDYVKGCRPNYGVRIRFAKGDDTVDVLFCFECDILEVYHNGEIAGGEDFDEASPDLAPIVAELFPDDAAIQAMAERKRRPNFTDVTMWPLWCGAALLVVAAGLNRFTGRIPNWYWFTSLTAGFCVAMLLIANAITPAARDCGFGSSLLSVISMFGILLPVWIVGRPWVPGGTVKMQCAFAAWVGCVVPFDQSLRVMLVGTLVGAVVTSLALLVALRLRSEPVEARPPGSSFPVQSFVTLGTLAVVVYEFWP